MSSSLISSNLLTALEDERRRLIKAKDDNDSHASAITAAYRDSVAEKQLTFSQKSRRYGKWVENQARKLDAKLDKKRKQMDRNKQRMNLGMETYHAEIESLREKIVNMETNRVVEEMHLSARLEEVEREIMANSFGTPERGNRSRAPSPELLPLNTNVANQAESASGPNSISFRAPCTAGAGTLARPTNLYNTIVQSSPTAVSKICTKLPPRKIIWKIKWSNASNAPLPAPAPAKQQKANAPDQYIWEEYDHSEVFGEPDNPFDEDYEPPIDE